MRWYFTFGTVLGLAALLVAAAPAAAGDIRCETVTIVADEYVLTDTPDGDALSVAGFGRLLIPGKPALPSRIFAVAIPPGAELVEVTCDPGVGVVLPGRYEIAPAPLPRVIGVEDPAIAARQQEVYEQNLAEVYSQDAAYPQQLVEFVRTAGYRAYNLVDVRVTPFAYQPLSGVLTYYPELTVNVHYRPAAEKRDVLVTPSARVARTAREIIANYDRAQTWYPLAEKGRGLYDFVIITTDSLTSAVTPLVNWEVSKGRTVQVVTTTWINTNYTGYDLAEKMRNFLRDKYPAGQWGIEDVLLVGHYDDVPMRRTAQDLGYGEPETDFYYAELSLPDDQSWDDDVDRQWGENSDPIDFYNEVNVGRIPWSGTTDVTNICNKSVAFEQNDDPTYKKNMLLLGAFFWEDTDNAVLMERKIAEPWMGDWTFTRLYEQNSTVYSTYPCDYELTHTNVMNVWPSGTYAFVNWAGHGSPTSCHIMGYSSAAFITSSDCSSLNDNYPAIIFADACSNSDTDYTNIGQAMLRRGAVGFVGSTKVALGCPGWSHPSHGSSQSMDYYFTTAVTSGNYTQGEAHQYALRQMYTLNLWGYVRYEMFEWGALWGNPDLAIASPAALTLSFPSGRPDYLAPGSATDITVEIVDGAEQYVPGSGLLYYRYDGGTYLTAPLVHDSGDLYTATLPAADCDDVPEYYVSADGDGGATVFSPLDAPSSVYTAGVGTLTVIHHDDFESPVGWTTDNGTASSGQWSCGVPVNDPGWDYDPSSDCDGSGQCYLTQNEMGNTDVDGGYVILYSPVIDMSAGDVTISYDYYLYLTRPQDDNDLLLVEISDNGGAGNWKMIARHNTSGGLTWRHHQITPADLAAAGVTLTSTMQLRFTANDADTQSINEAGVDGFWVTTFGCEMPYQKGDADCDGDVDFGDINPFVDAILCSSEPDPEACWAALHPDCPYMNADVNEDDAVSFGDINPFVGMLVK